MVAYGGCIVHGTGAKVSIAPGLCGRCVEEVQLISVEFSGDSIGLQVGYLV